MRQNSTSAAPGKYMQKGSFGPHVTLLHTFLCGAGFGRDITFDQDYGQVTIDRVKELQEHLQMTDIDGCFGPKTRATVKEKFGFDYDLACLTVPGTTRFVQDEGTPAVLFKVPMNKT